MAVSVFKTFSSGEILTAADLNSSLTQITGNGEDLGWPATKAKDLDGQELILDSDGDTSFTSDSDDVIDVKVGGTDSMFIGHGTGNTVGFLTIDPLTHSLTAGTNYGILQVGNTNPITAPAGTTSIVAGAYFEIPNWTATGTITTSATVYIEGAATEGATDYALYVDDGDVQFDGGFAVDGTTSALSVTDSGFEILDDGDPTKIAKFQCSSISSGTTRTFIFPNADATLVGASTTQTLINKTYNSGTFAGTFTGTHGYNGLITNPGQSLVIAYNSAADDNVTGNGATVTVDFDTEITDQSGDFASDSMTFPSTGSYLVSGQIGVAGITTAATTTVIDIITSNRTFRQLFTTGTDFDTGVGFPFSIIVEADASDTMTITIQGSGESSNVWDISGSGSLHQTFLTIALLA